MKKISVPSSNVNLVLPLCIGSQRNEELATRLIQALPIFRQYEADYLIRAGSQNTFSIARQNSVGTVTAVEMTNLYKATFARKNGPTRHIYDAIKLSAPGDICPLCNQRTVSTLDHYLAKAEHPALSITPANLVPACKDCNTDTSVRRAETAGEQTLHPYFDDVDDEIWLVANVEQTTPPVVRFFVVTPTVWSQTKQQMVISHFNKFGLAKLYTTHAAVEMINILGDLLATDHASGSIGIRDELLAKSARRRTPFRNGWQAAMYLALGQSTWFCGGGYRQIDTTRSSGA